MMYPRRWAGCALALASLPTGVFGQAPTGTSTPSGNAIELLEAVEAALLHHPSMGEARARREAAGGVLQQAKAANFPAVSTDASLARFQEPSLVAPLHGFDPSKVPDFDRTLVRGNLSVTYSVFDGGARRARIQEAGSGAAMAEVAEAATRMDLTAEVGVTFLEILSVTELLQAASAHRGALEAESDRVRQFLEEGKAAQVDLLRVEAALSQAEASVISLRSKRELEIGRLGRLTGFPVSQIDEVGLEPFRLRPMGPGSLQAALSRALENSPEVEGARRDLARASAQVRIARAAWFPKVRASGAYSDYGALSGGHTLEWQGSLQVSLPLFAGGARRGEGETAKAGERRASEALRAVELMVEDGVEGAMAAIEEAEALREALERGEAQAAEVARIEALALEVGSGIQAEFLRAQAGLFRARASLTQARHGEAMAWFRLARVMGELSTDWLRENMEVAR